MAEKEIHSGDAEALRKRAEETVVATEPQPAPLSVEESQRVVHELQVHQIELEMQNEELHRAHAELEVSRERYFDLYDLAPVGYFTLSEHGVILEANLTAAKLLGVERGALVRQPLPRFIVREDQDSYYTHRKALFLSGTPHAYELKLARKEGAPFWARVEETLARDGDGSHVSRAIISDITERKQAEEAFKESLQAKESQKTAEAANRAKDQFIAVLSHELRTPLTPALAMLDVLQTKNDLPVPLRSDLELIRRNVEIEVALIDDLLDITRINNGKIDLQRDVVDVEDCLRMALEICQKDINTKRLEVRLEFSAALHHVWADPARMRQVYWNLLSNAVKFTPEGGRITLRTRNEGDQLQIEIADTGIGIEPAVLPRVFNLFEQGEQGKLRQFGGLGLGLHIARAIVELHEGRLTAFSEGKNKGATFTVELNTVSPRENSVLLTPSSAAEERPLRILLVEDHLDTLQVFVKLLEKWGHAVTTAVSVRDAQELAAGQQFDLLISDLGLPDGSGLDVMRQMKTHSGIPGIALSGYGTDEDIRQSRDAGFSGHLVKPVNIAALRTAIRQCAFNGL